MTHIGYLIAGWGIGLGTLGAYGWSVVRRGRALARRVPAERQRWMTSGDARLVAVSGALSLPAVPVPAVEDLAAIEIAAAARAGIADDPDLRAHLRLAKGQIVHVTEQPSDGRT